VFSLVLFTFLTFGATRACFGLLCCCFTSFSVGVGLTVDFRHHHFSLLAQYAADILPLAMFFACRALKDF